MVGPQLQPQDMGHHKPDKTDIAPGAYGQPQQQGNHGQKTIAPPAGIHAHSQGLFLPQAKDV